MACIKVTTDNISICFGKEWESSPSKLLAIEMSDSACSHRDIKQNQNLMEPYFKENSQ